jgi:hypothetical protein
VDAFNKLIVGSAINAAALSENVLSLAVSYGLAAQALGLAPVSTNLLPEELLRARLWKQKRPWFTAAAAVLLLGLASMLYGVQHDIIALKGGGQDLTKTRDILKDISDIQRQYSEVKGKGNTEVDEISAKNKLFAYRSFWPSVYSAIAEAIQGVAGPEQRLFSQYVACDNATAEGHARQKELLAQMAQTPRASRSEILIDSIASLYQASLPGGKRGFELTLTGHTPLPSDQARPLLGKLADALPKVAEKFPALSIVKVELKGLQPYKGVAAGLRGEAGRAEALTPEAGGGERMSRGGERDGGERGSDRPRRSTSVAAPARTVTPGAPGAGPALPDPLLPNEDMSSDSQFIMVVSVAIASDGLTPVPPLEEASSPTQ